MLLTETLTHASYTRTVESLGGDEALMAGAVTTLFSETELVERLGKETADRLLSMCRGNDDSAVKPNLRPKSINTFKSFPSVTRMDDLNAYVLNGLGGPCSSSSSRIVVLVRCV